MKKILLVFALFLVGSATVFAQQDIKKIAENFKFTWNEHRLPNSSFLIYHGKEESYFLDSTLNRVPDHSYLDIKTGGKDHFIVQDEEGFHVLNTELERVTEKAYDKIDLNFGSEIVLTSGERVSFYAWDYEKKNYSFTDTKEPTPPWQMAPERTYNSKLGEVADSRFKAKRIERLRLGIDMSETLTVGQKGKNVLVKKGETLVYKGPTKPMLFYDFAITGTKGPHSVYHPISKKPILGNCDQFWFIGSFLVVSVKDDLRKHIISNTGEIILSSAGEIRYYNYEYGDQEYAFFCDGRSVINMNGDLIFRSDGELIGVGEHCIYAGYSGAHLGDLSHSIKMDCSNFERYNTLSIGKTGRNEYRVFNSKSVLVNKVNDYFVDKKDSLVICVEDSKTFVCDPIKETVINIHPIQVEGRLTQSKYWKYYVLKSDETGNELEGRFEPKKGVVVQGEYLKIEWPESGNYHIVLTKDGRIRYLDGNG
jgi:hypothetical protein